MHLPHFRRWQILFPSLMSKPVLLLAMHSSYLLMRTVLSIYVATLDGSIVRALVDRQGSRFLANLGKWMGIGVVATYINAMIRFLEQKLALSFRTALTEHALRSYMTHET